MALSNTLIDNSTDQLTMVSYLKKLIGDSDCQVIKIATGYWDLKGMALLLEELKDYQKLHAERYEYIKQVEPPPKR